MANWTILKEAIAGVIKTNGNQEITGQLLQNVLNNIVSSVGENASFAGIATTTTNPGTPDGPVFYLATQAGTYSNFNGIKIAEGEAIILEWNNGIWTKKISGLATEQEIIYDVSSHNDGVVFESLSALLSSSNLGTLIPTSVRHGGMTIRFIQGSISNSDNKYVQYRLMSNTFNTTPANWQSMNADDMPTAGSNNLVTSGGVDYRLKGIEDTIKNFSNFYDNTLYIADGSGNVVAKIDKDGVHSVNIPDWLGNVYQYPDDALYIADTNGNVVAKIDENGIRAVSKVNLYSIGDSLCATGKWQNKVAEITGCKFDQSINQDGSFPLSIGGTTMYLMGATENIKRCGMGRTLNLSHWLNNNSEGIIILECVNDFLGATNYKQQDAEVVVTNGTISDKPFMLRHLYNRNDYTQITSELLNSFSNEDRQFGSAINLKIGTSDGMRLTVNSTPTAAGSITLTVSSVNLSGNYSLTVSTTDSIEDIVDKIAEIAYGGVTAVKSSSSTIDFYKPTSITVDAGNTGVSISVSSAEVDVLSAWAFVGDNISDWTDTSKWIAANQISFYSAWKGIINYINTNFPKIKLFVLILPELNMKPSDYINTDGTYDPTTYLEQGWIKGRKVIAEAQREIARLYNIPIIDIEQTIGVNIGNYSQYYFDMDTHPKDTGYALWGEIIASELSKYVKF